MSDRKSTVIGVYFLASDAEKIRRAAARAQRSVSDWARRTMLRQAELERLQGAIEDGPP